MRPLSDEPVSASRITGVIPFFFYDAIARIVPGAFLLIGAAFSLTGGTLLTSWPAELQKTFPKDSTAGYAAAVVLLFLGVAHFLGVLLGSLSHAIVGRPWRRLSPLKLGGLAQHIGAADTKELSSRFRRCFGSELNDETLNEASFLCLYYVWTTDQNLGAMTTRIDAECLGAQSCVLVSAGLTLCTWLNVFRKHFWLNTCDWIWVASISLIAASAFLSFDYMRKKRLYGRFGLFLAISERETRSVAALPAGTGDGEARAAASGCQAPLPSTPTPATSPPK
jgi:hypothetical protein